MKMKLRPRKGVGLIDFNMPVAQVRALFSELPNTTRPNKYRAHPLDLFQSANVLVHYDVNGIVEALEFTNEARLTFMCVNLNKLTANKMRKFLQRLGKPFEEQGDSIISYKYGFNVYYPYKDSEPENKPETILVFRDGYWDD